MAGPESDVPTDWDDADRLTIDQYLLDDRALLNDLVVEAQGRYVHRIRTVYELKVPAGALATERVTPDPVKLGSDFTFLRERLTKAIWHNSYDATKGDPIWWWSQKAVSRIHARVEGSADVVLPDGSAVWLDGGPRHPLNVDLEIIHHETLELGRTSRVPRLSGPADDLARDQMAAVSHLAGPARVIAPAGSGKTRVLTSRLRHLVDDRHVEPEIITALAYNTRAADEMRERLPADLGSRIRTIHSLGWAILRMAQPHLTIIGDGEQRRRLEPIAPAPPRPNTDTIGPYLEGLSEVRIGLQSPEYVENIRDDVPDFAETFRKYRAGLDDRGEADYDEQIFGAIEALLADPTLRAHWQMQCRHMLVDEFQDMTPAYLLLLRLVASPGLNVFGVGDDDQVIYGYAGADPRFLIEFENLFPGATGYALSTNYRCPTDVVEGASRLLEYNDRRLPKAIKAASTNDGLTISIEKGLELGNVAVSRITDLMDSSAPGSIAVLSRVNSSLLPVQVALAEHGMRFNSTLNASVLDRTLLRAVFAWTRIALEPESMTRSDLLQAIRRPGRGLTRLFTESIQQRRGPFSIEAIEELGSQLDDKRKRRWGAFCADLSLAASSATSTTDLLNTLADDIGLSRAAAALDATRNLADRSGQTDDFVALQRVAGLHDDSSTFESWLRERLRTESSPDGVTLSTVHRVKGLEWDHVLVFGADSSLIPHHLSSDIEEERRIFHVALTRGRKTVTVLADRDNPSPFLQELDGSRPKVEPQVRERQVRSSGPRPESSIALGDEVRLRGGYQGSIIAITEQRLVIRLQNSETEMSVRRDERFEIIRPLSNAPSIPAYLDESLLDQLKNWRLAQSRLQGVPAFVVFHDMTLEDIATRRPTTAEELLEVRGIGAAKLDAYGEELLELLSTYEGNTSTD